MSRKYTFSSESCPKMSSHLNIRVILLVRDLERSFTIVNPTDEGYFF